MVSQIDVLARRVRRLRSKWARSLAITWAGIRIVAIVGGAALVSVAQFLDPASGTVPWDVILGFAGAGLAFMGGLADVIVGRSTPNALDEAQLALDMARDANRDMEDLGWSVEHEVAIIQDQYERLLKLDALVTVLREGVERFLADSVEVDESLRRLLQTACRPMAGAAGFAGDERWTVNVYRHVDDELRCVACVNADRNQSESDARSWGRNEGYVGACFNTQHELVLDDTELSDFAKLLHVPPGKRRESDSVTHRSIAAFPVRVSGLEEPWGVVIASSDLPDRFQQAPDTIGGLSAQAIRILAGMVALFGAAESRS